MFLCGNFGFCTDFIVSHLDLEERTNCWGLSSSPDPVELRRTLFNFSTL